MSEIAFPIIFNDGKQVRDLLKLYSCPYVRVLTAQQQLRHLLEKKGYLTQPHCL